MYVPGDVAAELEAVRRKLDPIQSALIPAHVTLCREDEFSDLNWHPIHAKLSGRELGPITLQFGKPEVFAGHGVLLNCVGGEEEFRFLRDHLLGYSANRTLRPHITLAHPRNPRAAGNSLANDICLPEILSITFPTIHLIEQEGNDFWKVLQVFDLVRRATSDA